MVSENRIRRNNIITPIALLLFIGSVSFLGYEMARNNKLRDRLMNERLTSEALLSEKLLLEKEVIDIESQYKDLRDKRRDLENVLTDTKQKLQHANQLLASSKSQIATVSNLKSQNKELSARNLELEQQLVRNSVSLAELQNSKDNLDLSLATLQEQSKTLEGELYLQKMLTMNGILIEPTKRNDKLTIIAKRTKKITVNVDIPTAAKNLGFKITNPKGEQVPQTDITFQTISKTEGKPQSFYAAKSLSPELADNRVQMTYSTQGKLIAGLYTIEILSDARSIGSLQVKLR